MTKRLLTAANVCTPDGTAARGAWQSIKRSEGIDKDTGMYAVPEVFDKELRVGAIVEVEVLDPANQKTQWVPAKVVRLDARGAFHVDIKIITSDERGSWEEKYTAKEENKEWRWPNPKANSPAL